MAVGRDVVMKLKGEQDGSMKSMWKSAEGGFSKMQANIVALSQGFNLISQAAGKFRDAVIAVHELVMEYENAEKVNRRFAQLFADNAGKMNTWAIEFANSIGRQDDTIKEWLNSFQSALTTIGLARDAASVLSQELTETAVKFARWNGLLEKEVVNDFRMSLVTGRSALRQFGITMDEDTTKIAAYRLGIAELGEKLTKQQEVQTRIKLLFEQTAEAQSKGLGLLSDYEDKTNRLDTAWGEFKETLGETLAPIALHIVKGITDDIRALATSVKWIRDKFKELRGETLVDEKKFDVSWLTDTVKEANRENQKKTDELKKQNLQIETQNAGVEYGLEALKETEDSYKQIMDDEARITEEKKKQADQEKEKLETARKRLAEEYGFMSRSDRERVKRLSEKLSGPGGEDFIRKASEDTLRFISGNALLRAQAQPYARSIAQKDLGITVNFNAESDGIAQKLLEEVLPRIKEALWGMQNDLSMAMDFENINTQAGFEALAGG